MVCYLNLDRNAITLRLLVTIWRLFLIIASGEIYKNSYNFNRKINLTDKNCFIPGPSGPRSPANPGGPGIPSHPSVPLQPFRPWSPMGPSNPGNPYFLDIKN